MNRSKCAECWKNRQMGSRRPVIIRFFVLWAMLCGFVSACETDSHPSPWLAQNSLTIGQYLEKHQENYSKFYQLLVDARMLQTLYAYNPNGKDWTLFLPTDEAIEQMIMQQEKYANFEELIKDTAFIKKFTRYHILKKRAHTNDFPDGAFMDSTLTGERIVAGFFINGNDQLIKINNVVPISQANLEMTNGYIHVISGALQPATLSGYDWLQQHNDYQILAKAMELSGIRKKLAWDKYTLLVEPDSIYHRYGIHTPEELVARLATPGMALTNKANTFYQYTTYHILSGENYLNDFMWGTHKYLTFSEQLMTIIVGQDIRINPGIDTYGTVQTPSGDTLVINYIRPLPESCNQLTRTGPVHPILDLMYYEKLPKANVVK